MKVNGRTQTSPVVGHWNQFGPDLGILRSPSGQSLLEVALLTPMLLALLLGVIEMGRYAYISILVGSAARAGVAYGAQNLAQTADILGIQKAADNDFRSNGQDPTSLAVNPSTSCGCDTGGSLSALTNVCSTQANPAIDGAVSSCSGTTAHWVVMVSVTASGTFNSLFNYPGIPKTLTVSNTATLRVAQI
jgi:Flp pilus assembly protein TadG